MVVEDKKIEDDCLFGELCLVFYNLKRIKNGPAGT